MKKNISSLQKVLNTWGIVLIIWSIYRAKLMLPEWVDEFIVKPAIFILPAYIYIVKIEKKKFFNQIWLYKSKINSDIAIGLSLGTVFASAAFIANYTRLNNFSFLQNILSQNLFYLILLNLATALSEEILSRGFLLKRLYEDSKNVYSSSFLASLLFLILHIPILFTIPNLGGTMLLFFLGTDFVLSLVNSIIFLEQKSLLGPILIHAFYNVAILMYI